VPLLGAVGPLQFEVVQFRMQTEYGAESKLEHGNWKVLRWARAEHGTSLEDTLLPTGSKLAYDVANQPVLLFPEQWACDFFADRNPKIQLSKLPFEDAAEVKS
jgi:peptide chain release factor 3